MIKNWLQNRRTWFQEWLDRPLKEKRDERKRELISTDRERLWRAEPLPVRAGSALGKPDPYRQLGSGPHSPATHGIAVVRGERLLLTHETIQMLKAMDQRFMEGASQAVDWMQVRMERRQARNLEVAERQGRAMFDGRTADINAMTEEEAIEFVRAQQAAIVARAKHASDPNSADTTAFAGVIPA